MTGPAAVFAPHGACSDALPRDLASRPGWVAWASGHDVRVCHHATEAARPFAVFRRQDEGSVGFHFGSLAAAADRHAAMGRPDAPGHDTTVSVLIRTRNPLRLRDRHTWDLRDVAGELLSLGVVGEEAAEEIARSADTQAVFAAVELGGHDCAVYANETEGAADGRADSVMTWRASSVRSIHCAAFDEADPRLCPRMEASRRDLEEWRENEDGIDRWKALFAEMKGIDAGASV